MKGTIRIQTQIGGKQNKVEIPTSYVFKMFGLTFAAHRSGDIDGEIFTAYRTGWKVSEVSTGLTLGVYDDTRKGVITKAKERLTRVGETEVKACVDYNIRIQKTEGTF